MLTHNNVNNGRFGSRSANRRPLGAIVREDRHFVPVPDMADFGSRMIRVIEPNS
jgi:hypothetical protein